MDIRFQQHLMQTQANEMVKYIEQLETNNAVMLQFIKQHGLEEEFNKVMTPQEEEAPVQQESTPIEE